MKNSCKVCGFTIALERYIETHIDWDKLTKCDRWILGECTTFTFKDREILIRINGRGNYRWMFGNRQNKNGGNGLDKEEFIKDLAEFLKK